MLSPDSPSRRLSACPFCRVPVTSTQLISSRAAILVAAVLMASSCGGVDDGSARKDPVDLSSFEETSEAEVAIDVGQRHQTLEGFGAAVGWYGGFLAYHPNRDEVNELLFADMGADIVRMRNTFGREEWEWEAPAMVAIADGAEQALGRPLKIQMSSWSPPAELKDNRAERCDNVCQFNGEDCVDAVCTLTKNDDGEFVYDEFAQYWRESLEAYAAVGIRPDWISIQNEPDFLPNGWEGCRFEPEETDQYPSYAQAVEQVHDALLEMDDVPKLLGPETLGVHGNRVLRYTSGMNMSHLYGVAHHLYEENARPDSFLPWFEEIDERHGDLPLFQTEFSGGDMFDTAWLIHNSLSVANAVAYVYWELIWNYAGPDDAKGLISLENPGQSEEWETARGYAVQPDFHALRHFARYTDPGHVRVATSSTQSTVRASAFISPEEDALTVVLLNVGEKDKRIELDIAGFDGGDVVGFSSHDEDYWEELARPQLDSLEIPARGIVTLVIDSR